MRMIDTHSHLYTEEFDADRAEVMQRAISLALRLQILRLQRTKNVH